MIVMLLIFCLGYLAWTATEVWEALSTDFFDEYRSALLNILMPLPCDFLPILCVFVLHWKNYANNTDISDDKTSSRASAHKPSISSYSTLIKDSEVSSPKKSSKMTESDIQCDNDYLITSEDLEICQNRQSSLIVINESSDLLGNGANLNVT